MSAINPSNPLLPLLQGLTELPALLGRVDRLEKELAALRRTQAAPKKEQWLTLKETAGILRMSEKSITRLIKKGKLRRNLDSYRVLIRGDDVESYAGRATLPAR